MEDQIYNSIANSSRRSPQSFASFNTGSQNPNFNTSQDPLQNSPAPHRVLKNIILCLILLVTSGLTVLTGYFAIETMQNNAATSVENSADSTTPAGSNNPADSTNTPPELPSNDTSSNNSSEEPPAKPDGEDSSNTSTEEPPEKPDGETSTESNGSTTNSSDNSATNSTNSSTGTTDSTEPPEKPDGEAAGGSNADNLSDDDNNLNTNTPNNGSNTLPAPFYFLFAAEGLVFAAAALYLIMSRACRRTFRTTFKNSDKITIFILATIIIIATFAIAGKLTTEALATSTTIASTSSTDTDYNAVLTIDSDTELSSETYSASSSDQLAILATGNLTATLDNFTINKTGDSDGGDNTSFYGTNSAILAKSGAVLNIKNSTITTDATGANGVFSFGGSATTSNNTTNSGDGTTVNISDSTITTSKDNSGGIMTTGGGIMNATNLTITTAGTSSAAIRSDRGGGTVTVDQGTYTTTGQGSPAVYSTADITVKNAKLDSQASEGIVIEGKNSVSLENVELTDNNTKLNGQSTTYKNIFLYQSMSGDAAEGTATFSAKNSTITTNSGDSFYITNTTAEINLENNTIINNDESGNFLRIQADSWGNSGSNGGTVTMNLTNQSASGNIVVDNISELTLNLTSGSTFSGAINTANTAQSLVLTLSADSHLTLTADTYLTSLTDADTTYSNINFNGHKLYVNGTAIN